MQYDCQEEGIRKAADRRTNARKGWRDDRKDKKRKSGMESGVAYANLYISHRLICSTRSRRKGKNNRRQSNS